MSDETDDQPPVDPGAISGKATLLLGILPALVVIGAFSGGLFHALQTGPARPDVPEEEVVEEVVEVKPDPQRMYLDIINPIRATIPELGGTVSINIGLAVRDDMNKDVIEKLKSAAEPIVAPLAETILDIIPTLPPQSDWHDLRKRLPKAFRERLNQDLTSPDVPDPVYEVLIMNFAVGS